MRLRCNPAIIRLCTQRMNHFHADVFDEFYKVVF